MNVLFSIDRESTLENLKRYCGKLLKDGVRLLEFTTGIPVPESIFDRLFNAKDKGDDALKYMESCRGQHGGYDTTSNHKSQ